MKQSNKEIIEVVTARMEGKQIQFFDEESKEWLDCINNDPAWEFSSYDYRVKPEPKIRPYTIEELIINMKSHGNILRMYGRNGILSDDYYIIRTFNKSIVIVSHTEFTYEEFAYKFVWADNNSPCGVK